MLQSLTQYWRKLSITTKFSLAFGLLFLLILVVAITGYLALTFVRRQTDAAILVSTNIQRLVLEMKGGLEEARRLERDFFLQYPKIGFAEAYRIYAEQAGEHIAEVTAMSSELRKLIARSDVSEALQRSDVNLNLYLLAASQYGKAFDEAVILVEALAADETGLRAQLEHHSSSLQKTLARESPELLIFYYRMQAYEKEYLLTRKRPSMQTAFNVAFSLRQAIEREPLPEENHVLTDLDAYLAIAEEILRIDVNIRSKTNEFDLQTEEALVPISEELIFLAGKEVKLAREHIQSTSLFAMVILVVTAIAGLLLAGITAAVMNSSITWKIVTLTNVAKELQEGHLKVSAPIHSTDELGQLADTFNAMAIRIDSLVSNLEHKVAERTEKLTIINTQLQEEIAERKHAEEEVQQLNAELEKRVGKRTAELEAVNKELKSFAYVASHDLKAPLRGISQLAQWLIIDYEDGIDEEGQNMLRLLINRVKRMDNLINGILEYSRIGRIVGKNEKIDLEFLVAEVIDSIAPPDHIQIRIESELPIIVADITRITQMFQNLLSNAAKFMDKSNGEITIRCLDNDTAWKFSVADNGPGIDPKYHEKIFQIFQTLVPRDERENTGIGLALVKKIVELHGGRIWVESTVGKGSTFFFSLPKERKRSSVIVSTTT